VLCPLVLSDFIAVRAGVAPLACTASDGGRRRCVGARGRELDIAMIPKSNRCGLVTR
jgi:hypothetical protein